MPVPAWLERIARPFSRAGGGVLANPRLRKAALGLGYTAWFVLLFLALVWFTFPWSRVRDQVVVAAQDAGWDLRVGRLGSATFGLRAKGVALARVAGDGQEPRPDLLAFEKLSVETGLGGALRTGLLLRKAGAEGGTGAADLARQVLASAGRFDLGANLYGGELDARIESQDEVARVALHATDLDLSQYSIATGRFTARPRGRLRAEADVTWHWEDAHKSSGNVDVIMSDLVLADCAAWGFGLPETAFSASEAHLKLSRGRADLRDTRIEADEIQATVEGFVSLSTSVLRSRLALKLRFKLRDDLDGLVKGLMGGNPTHRDADGWYHYQVNGTLTNPRLRPSPISARGARDRTRVPSPADLEGGDDDDMTPRRPSLPRGDKVERQPLSDGDKDDLEAQRAQMQEERERLREERRQRREEAMRRRRERQAEIGGGAMDGRSGTAGAGMGEKEMPRSNYPPGEEPILEEPIFEEPVEEPIFEEPILEEPIFEEVPEAEPEGEFQEDPGLQE